MFSDYYTARYFDRAPFILTFRELSVASKRGKLAQPYGIRAGNISLALFLIPISYCSHYAYKYDRAGIEIRSLIIAEMERGGGVTITALPGIENFFTVVV